MTSEIVLKICSRCDYSDAALLRANMTWVHFSFLQQATKVGTVFIASAVENEFVGQARARQADSHGGRDEYGPYTGCLLQKLKCTLTGVAICSEGEIVSHGCVFGEAA
jgi:hypothetical protein